jgi:hypothetical protein
MRLPSVTQIIGSILPPCEFYTDEGRIRGQAVHAALAAALMDDWAPDVPEACQGFVDSGLRFIREVLPTINGNFVIDWKTGAGVADWWGVQLAAYQTLATTIISEPGLHIEKELSHNGHRYCGHPDVVYIADTGPFRRITVRVQEDGGPALANDWPNIVYDWAVFVSMTNIVAHFPRILKKDERYAD